jgi:hypothetical protein
MARSMVSKDSSTVSNHRNELEGAPFLDFSMTKHQYGIRNDKDKPTLEERSGSHGGSAWE